MAENKIKPIIITGFCKCGHPWEDHHLNLIIDADYYSELIEQFPFHPSYIPGECEHYGSNEMSGLDEKGEIHCQKYEDNLDPCPFGCLFLNGKLQGDCRAPWRKECLLNCLPKKPKK